MKSMTGYGCANTTIGGFDINMDISSVNKRGLDVHVSLPREWQVIERDIISAIRKIISRGKVNLHVSVKAESSGDTKCWNTSAVKQILGELKQLAESCDVPFAPDGELLLRVAQSASQHISLPAAEDVKNDCLALVSRAVEQLDCMRSDEGGNLKEDLVSRLDLLTDLTTGIRENSKSTVSDYRQQLYEKLKSFGIDIDLDDDRVLKEIAIFADRADNSEEITRLASHIDQFRAMLLSEEPVGRPMDFLCQELNREINTVGSKANNSQVTKSVLEMKNELEKIREQIQNVE